MRASPDGHALALSLVFAVTAGTACAQSGDDAPEPLSPDAFIEAVEGRTVHYTRDGDYYGSERFYGKGRATWQFPGDNCEDGLYWIAEDEICFRYGTASCWAVFEDDAGAMAAVSRDGFAVSIARIDDAPLRCDGAPVS